MAVSIELFTDPACPFAFSGEPARQRLRWHYGDAITWTVRMIVLTLEPGEAEKLAEGADGLQRKYGMPIDPRPYPRTASSEPACRALVDDPALIDGAAGDVGIDAGALAQWVARPDVEAELQADIAAARAPSAA